METLEDAVKRLILEEYGSIRNFSDAADIPTSSIYSALSRGLKNTRTETADKIYRTLNLDWSTVDSEDFSTLQVKQCTEPYFVEVGVVSEIAAGVPIELTECDYTFPCPRVIHEAHPHSRWYKVVGNSWNKKIPNGCLALVDFDLREPMNDRTPFAVCVNGYTATIKSIQKLENGYRLLPNSWDETIRPLTFDYNNQDTDEVTIMGEVVYATFPFDYEV